MLEYSLQSFIRLKIDFTSVNINGLKDTFVKVKGRLQAWQLSSALSNTETLPKTWSMNAIFVSVMGYFACFWQYRNIRMWSYGSVNQFLYSNCSCVGGPESSPGQSPFPSSTDLKPQWKSRQVLQWSCTQQSSVLLRKTDPLDLLTQVQRMNMCQSL